MLTDTSVFSPEEDNLLPAKLVLNFLTILWRRGFRERLLGQTMSTFINLLVDHLSHEHPHSLPSVLLCDSLLIALATLDVTKAGRSFGVNKLWEDETIWQLAMEFCCSNLPIACESGLYNQLFCVL